MLVGLCIEARKPVRLGAHAFPPLLKELVARIERLKVFFGLVVLARIGIDLVITKDVAFKHLSDFLLG